MASLLQCVVRTHIIRNATKVALIVGTILNLINQGNALFGSETISWPHVFLNYLVPYCVASYSAAKNELAHNKE